MLRHILGSIVVLSSPLCAHALRTLLDLTKEDVVQTLEDLHSVIDIPQDDMQPLHLHHPSFRDFLLSEKRCKDPNFWVDEKQAHQRLVDGCLRVLSASLKQDICEVRAPGMLAANMERSRIEQCLPPEVQYACLFWDQHLEKSDTELCDEGQVHVFLQKHFLYWLEALGWMGKVSEGVHAVIRLESIAAVINPRDISDLLLIDMLGI
jgi:hypothetical protein